MEARVLSILAVRCVDCGDAERLITVTADAVISRCYVCGDVEIRRRGAASPGRRRMAAPPAQAAG
jgi:ribosomal protein S27E